MLCYRTACVDVGGSEDCCVYTVIMCSQKLHVYLFDEVFVMTRCYNHTDTMAYQVYRQPIALSDLAVKDYADISLTRKGSFRNAFSQLQTSKLFMTIYWCCYVGRRHLYCSEFVIVCVCMCVYMWQCVWVDCCLYHCQLYPCRRRSVAALICISREHAVLVCNVSLSGSCKF